MENTGAKRTMYDLNYGFAREVPFLFEEAIISSKNALQAEGFGVLSEIRIDEKFKEKLGVDFRKYVILGACNPTLAYKTAQEDINIGLLLPCNVVVYEADEPDKSVVAVIDATAMMSVVGDKPEIAQVAKVVNEKLRQALESI